VAAIAAGIFAVLESSSAGNGKGSSKAPASSDGDAWKQAARVEMLRKSY
jgi:hypothetical protein